MEVGQLTIDNGYNKNIGDYIGATLRTAQIIAPLQFDFLNH